MSGVDRRTPIDLATASRFRRIAGIGPAYEVMAINGDRCTIRRLDEDETIDYPLAEAELDPHPDEPYRNIEPNMKVRVHIFLKPGVLDVQGKAVEGALKGLGWGGVSDARVGKLIEFDWSGEGDVEAEVKRMCETLLANTVIESYRIEVG